MLSQDLLREELARRVDAARIGLGSTAGRPPDDTDASASVAAIVVVRDIDMKAFVIGALTHTLMLPAPAQDAWLRAFTRTLFLAGNPDRLQRRHPTDHRSPDGGIGWYAAAPPSTYLGLRRLLRTFDGPRMPADAPAVVRLRVPGCGAAPPRARRLFVDVCGLGIAQYLVHVHHSVCEAAISGLIGRGDALELVHVQEIDESVGRWEYARVHVDHRDDSRLRLYACLSEPLADASGERGSASADRKEDHACQR
jgi:hypothetical protein